MNADFNLFSYQNLEDLDLSPILCQLHWPKFTGVEKRQREKLFVCFGNSVDCYPMTTSKSISVPNGNEMLLIK